MTDVNVAIIGAGPYGLAEQRWDSPITARLARRSVAAWLDEVKDRIDAVARVNGSLTSATW